VARSLGEIVARFGGELRGDGARTVSGLATLDSATPDQLSFLANPKYCSQLAATRAGAVILAPEAAVDCPCAAIVTPQPYLYFARVSQWLAEMPPAPPGIHPSAVVESRVPDSASIGPQCWIGPAAEIGENVVLGAQCRIGAGAVIGAGSHLYPDVTIYHGCRVGRRTSHPIPAR